MIKLIKARLAAKTAQAELELHSITLAANQLSEANVYAQADPDEADWQTVGTVSDGKDLTEQQMKTSRGQSRKFFRFNPHGKSIIRNMAKFVIGRGVKFITLDTESGRKKKINKVWGKFVEINKWLLRQKEIVTRGFRDGEVFLRYFPLSGKDSGYLAFRFIDPDTVANPPNATMNVDSNNKTSRGTILTYGIEHNAEDIEDIKWYWVDNKPVKADEIIHIKLLADSDQKRGVPYMESVLEDIKNYRNWLKDRIVLNKIRTAIALIRKIPAGVGTPTQINSIRDQNSASIHNVKSSKVQAFEPGTILTTRGIEYEYLTPNLEARDSAQDGRNILLNVAAGVGMPEYMVTADSSNANYSSTMVAESPAVKEFEDWQDFFAVFFQAIYKLQMEHAKKKRILPAGSNTDCKVEFPTLVMRDLQKEARAYSLMRDKGVISIKTWRGKAGLDDQIENENMADEDTGETVVSKLAVPPEPEPVEPEEPDKGDDDDEPKGGKDKPADNK